MLVAMVAGDDAQGGDARWVTYSANVATVVGKAFDTWISLVNCANLFQALWYCVLVAGASDAVRSAEAPVTRAATRGEKELVEGLAMVPPRVPCGPGNEKDDLRLHCDDQVYAWR